MILFVAASLALSEALVLSGAGRWLVDVLMVRSGLSTLQSQLAVLAGVAVITLTAHLYITSRSARGAVIAPLVILLALSLEIDPRLLAWVTAAGVGYCITLVVSAKPLTMFQQMSGSQPAFSAGDLARLSSVLAPLHIALILIFALFYWPQMLKPLPAAAADAPQAMRASAPEVRQTPGLPGNGSLAPNVLLAEARIARVGGSLQLITKPVRVGDVESTAASGAMPAVVLAPASHAQAPRAVDAQSGAAPAPNLIPAPDDASSTLQASRVESSPTGEPASTEASSPHTPAPLFSPSALDDALAAWQAIGADGGGGALALDGDELLFPARPASADGGGDEGNTEGGDPHAENAAPLLVDDDAPAAPPVAIQQEDAPDADQRDDSEAPPAVTAPPADGKGDEGDDSEGDDSEGDDSESDDSEGDDSGDE